MPDKLPYILHIETSGSTCSVALSCGLEKIGLRESHEDKSHASILTVYIQDLLMENHLSTSVLDAVSVSMGPGSYTGLRIGVAVAKGICFASDIPLIGINSLEAMAYGMKSKYSKDPSFSIPVENFLLCPMMDARRQEVYQAVFDQNGNMVNEVKALILQSDSYQEILNQSPILFFGSGAKKASQILKHPSAIFMDIFKQSAEYMIELAYVAYIAGNFENTAYFEPFYLKDFIPTTPRKRL